jgi:beta-lactam-binding protein with PASTA domain
MPNVVGMNAAVAADELKRAGFTRIEFGTQDSDAFGVYLPENWTVAKQSAKAGTVVTTDTLVVLTCTKKA